MSRIGKLPIRISSNIEVKICDLNVKILGPKGVIEQKFSGPIVIEYKNSQITVLPLNDSSSARAMWGTARSIINSMVIGVTEGFQEELELHGVGYKAAVQGKYLNLALGKSHNTKIEIIDEVTVRTINQNKIIVESYDKQKLGQYVATIRSQRPPEPYKGKGIKRKGEYIQRKEGKKN